MRKFPENFFFFKVPKKVLEGEQNDSKPYGSGFRVGESKESGEK